MTNEQIRAEFEEWWGAQKEWQTTHEHAWQSWQAAHARYAGSDKQTRTELPEGVTRVRNAATGEYVGYAGSGSEAGYKGWYCSHCRRGVDGSEVTFNEQHQVCGRVITNDEPPVSPTPAVPDVLWCMHVIGPDDVYPAPSKEVAEIGVNMFNRIFADHADKAEVLCKAEVAPWPYDAESHAADAKSFVESFILPPPQKANKFPASAVPEGYALVPIEPTEAMVMAAKDFCHQLYNKLLQDSAAIGYYKAMLTQAKGE